MSKQQLIEEFPLLKLVDLYGVDDIQVRKINRIWFKSRPTGRAALILRDEGGDPFVYCFQYQPPAVAFFERDHPGQEVLAALVWDHSYGTPEGEKTVLYYLKPREGFGVEEMRTECAGLCPAALR